MGANEDVRVCCWQWIPGRWGRNRERPTGSMNVNSEVQLGLYRRRAAKSEPARCEYRFLQGGEVTVHGDQASATTDRTEPTSSIVQRILLVITRRWSRHMKHMLLGLARRRLASDTIERLSSLDHLLSVPAGQE